MMTLRQTTLLLALVVLAVPAKTQQSRLGSFQAQVAVAGEAQTAKQINTFSVTVADEGGKLQYTITRQLAYDVGPPAVAVFESGSCVLLDSFHGLLDFYTSEGHHLRTANLSKEPVPELERQMPFSVHDRTVTLAVAEPQSTSLRLLRFSDEGEQIFSSTIPGQFATGIVVSNAGTSCAVGTADWREEEFREQTSLVSEAGFIQQTVSVGLTLGVFSQDDRVLCAATKHAVAMIAVSSGELLSSATFDPKELPLDISSQRGEFYILKARVPTFNGKQWVYSDPSVLEVGPGGERREIFMDGGRLFNEASLRSRAGVLELELDGSLRRFP